MNVVLWQGSNHQEARSRTGCAAVATVITLMITGKIVVTSSTISEMFKFDFVQDGDEDKTQTVHNEKKEANERALTEISLIELVCTRLSLR